MALSWLETWLNKKWVQHSLRIFFAVLITALLIPFRLDWLEFNAYDVRMQLSPSPNSSGQVVLLTLDHETIKQLKREPEALDWAYALQKIAHAEPAHVVSFINPTQILGTYEDLSLLSETMGRMPFTFGENDLPKTGLLKLEPLPAPFETIPIEPAPKTADRSVLAKDGATRRLILSYENHFTLHPRLAQIYNKITDQKDYRGIFDFLDSRQLLIRYRTKGSYPKISFIDALEKDLPKEMLQGKIILIGKDTQEVAADYVTTPLSKDLLALSQLELHANILDTLIRNDAPTFSPDWIKWLITFIIALATIYIVLSVRPVKGLALLALTLVVLSLISVVAFALFGWVVPVAHPLMAVFICYYFIIPYRLIIENRRSWEYYEKNRLLTQVEELKSNFMRMMSHDLKTPLARIQGMTEVIRKEPIELTKTQKLALSSIAESSEELTDFIGSILSLSRIESKEMKLHARSRDINQLLREVIHKVDYLAERKGISIVTELEPLFSIRVDDDLLKTVFTNLLENAVKYSDPNTKILVTTEESNGEVIVQIADQGRGISQDELGFVFERFYRARNTRATTAGNGLGLFLAKYFVELHQGRIEVESELNKGSTFTVRLPMNLTVEEELMTERGGDLHV